jgi:hypothetical protein
VTLPRWACPSCCTKACPLQLRLLPSPAHELAAHRVRLQISQARHTAYEGGSQAPPPLPAIPKVALLFLIKTTLPTEPVWRLFFDSAAAAASKLTSSGSQAGWELLFSVYVHPAAEHSLPSDSWFAGREVSGRQATVWGNHSLVDAERALLRAALRDPLNQRFALLSGAQAGPAAMRSLLPACPVTSCPRPCLTLQSSVLPRPSESCIPLYSGPAVYAQLMWEQRSRINACRRVHTGGLTSRACVLVFDW